MGNYGAKVKQIWRPDSNWKPGTPLHAVPISADKVKRRKMLLLAAAVSHALNKKTTDSETRRILFRGELTGLLEQGEPTHVLRRLLRAWRRNIKL